MFSQLGFEPEGLLKDHVRSRAGEVHDLLVLAHFVEPLWASMRTTGVEDLVLGEPSSRLMAAAAPVPRCWPRRRRWPAPGCGPSGPTACRGR